MLGCAEMLVLFYLDEARELRQPFSVLLLGCCWWLTLSPYACWFCDLRTTLSRIYTRWQLYGIGALSLGGGLLVPLCLLLVADNSLFMLGAAMCIVLGNLLIRFVIIKLPHASL